MLKRCPECANISVIVLRTHEAESITGTYSLCINCRNLKCISSENYLAWHDEVDMSKEMQKSFDTTVFLKKCSIEGWDLDNDDIKLILDGDFETVDDANTCIPDDETDKILKEIDRVHTSEDVKCVEIVRLLIECVRNKWSLNTSDIQMMLNGEFELGRKTNGDTPDDRELVMKANTMQWLPKGEGAAKYPNDEAIALQKKIDADRAADGLCSKEQQRAFDANLIVCTVKNMPEAERVAIIAEIMKEIKPEVVKMTVPPIGPIPKDEVWGIDLSNSKRTGIMKLHIKDHEVIKITVEESARASEIKSTVTIPEEDQIRMNSQWNGDKPVNAIDPDYFKTGVRFPKNSDLTGVEKTLFRTDFKMAVNANLVADSDLWRDVKNIEARPPLIKKGYQSDYVTCEMFEKNKKVGHIKIFGWEKTKIVKYTAPVYRSEYPVIFHDRESDIFYQDCEPLAPIYKKLFTENFNDKMDSDRLIGGKFIDRPTGHVYGNVLRGDKTTYINAEIENCRGENCGVLSIFGWKRKRTGNKK